MTIRAFLDDMLIVTFGIQFPSREASTMVPDNSGKLIDLCNTHLLIPSSPSTVGLVGCAVTMLVATSGPGCAPAFWAPVNWAGPENWGVFCHRRMQKSKNLD